MGGKAASAKTRLMAALTNGSMPVRSAETGGLDFAKKRRRGSSQELCFKERRAEELTLHTPAGLMVSLIRLGGRAPVILADMGAGAPTSGIMTVVRQGCTRRCRRPALWFYGHQGESPRTRPE